MDEKIDKEPVKERLKKPHNQWRNKYHVIKEFKTSQKVFKPGVHWADKIWPQQDAAITKGLESEERINRNEYKIKFLGAYPVDIQS